MTQTNPTKKDLVHQGQPLKMFIFSVQGGTTPIWIAEDLHAVTAYTSDEALNTIRTKYPPNTLFHWKSRGEIAVQELLNVINLPEAPTATSQSGRKVKPPKTAEQFVASLLLVMDMFIPERVDQEIIKGILNKVNLYDPKEKTGEGEAGRHQNGSSDSDGSATGTEGAN